MNKKSILRRLKIAMISFGIIMGLIFPLYANFFASWEEGKFVYFSIGCIAAGIIVGLVSFFFVKSILLKQLKKVSSLASDISDKNLTGHIEIESDDMVGVIIDGLNAAVKSIKDLFLEVKKISNISESMLKRVDGNKQNIETGEPSDSAVERIRQSISIVTSRTNEMMEHSSRIFKAVDKGLGSVSHSQSRFQKTTDNVIGLSNTVTSLVTKSNKINEKLKLIEEIANQTNLVSINASIEASKAGQFGKSFGAVAIEIRNLANVTQSASKEIHDYIHQIQGTINMVNNDIIKLKNDINDNNQDIIHVKAEIQDIEESTKSNQDTSKDLVTSVNDLNNSFSDVATVLSQLSNNINNLQYIINAYKY